MLAPGGLGSSPNHPTSPSVRAGSPSAPRVGLVCVPQRGGSPSPPACPTSSPPWLCTRPCTVTSDFFLSLVPSRKQVPAPIVTLSVTLSVPLTGTSPASRCSFLWPQPLGSAAQVEGSV